MKECIGRHDGRGLVSVMAPLVSNLNAWENIALIAQYHRNVPKKTARAETLALLETFGLHHRATARSSELNEEERFRIMLLRAAMMKDVLIIDRPFSLVPAMTGTRALGEDLKKLYHLYQQCYIFDYQWNSDKYGIEYAEAR